MRADLRLESVRAAVHLQHHAFDHVRAIIDHLRHRLFVVNVLRERHKEQWRSPMTTRIGVVSFANNANDLKGLAALHIIEPEVRSDRVFTLLEKLAHKRFVNNSDVPRSRRVLFA